MVADDRAAEMKRLPTVLGGCWLARAERCSWPWHYSPLVQLDERMAKARRARITAIVRVSRATVPKVKDNRIFSAVQACSKESGREKGRRPPPFHAARELTNCRISRWAYAAPGPNSRLCRLCLCVLTLCISVCIAPIGSILRSVSFHVTNAIQN